MDYYWEIIERWFGPDPFGEKDRALWVESLKKRWGLVSYTDRESFLEQKDPISQQKD